MKPLEGIRVVDFTQVLAGPLCTQYLGDLGADIIKIEPCNGDDTRRWPPFREGIGTLFLSVNRNKRSLAIDLKSAEGKAIVNRLVAQADVVVESFSNGVTERLGIDYAALKQVNPSLVYCSVSGYGTTGPMQNDRGYDLVLQAFTGMLELTGHPGGGPTRIPFSPIDQGTGLHALSGILAALFKRSRNGEGSFLEVSLFETAMAFLGFNIERFWAKGQLPVKSGSGHESLCPYQVFQASDANVLVGIANNGLWERFCKFIERPELLEDPLFVTNAARAQNSAATNALVQSIISKQTCGYWIENLTAIGVPCANVNTLEDVLASPQTAARKIVLDYEHPELGAQKAIAHPVQFDQQDRSAGLSPPMLGEHTTTILAELGYGDQAIQQLRASGIIATISDPGMAKAS